MNLTEKEKLLEWSAENCTEQVKKAFFLDSDENSYYVKRDNEHCIEEYSWDSIPELKNKLDEIWRENSVLRESEKIVLASVMKAYQTKQESGKLDADAYDLPEYVYVF